jgi:hypothetical protein
MLEDEVARHLRHGRRQGTNVSVSRRITSAVEAVCKDCESVKDHTRLAMWVVRDMEGPEAQLYERRSATRRRTPTPVEVVTVPNGEKVALLICPVHAEHCRPLPMRRVNELLKVSTATDMRLSPHRVSV